MKPCSYCGETKWCGCGIDNDADIYKPEPRRAGTDCPIIDAEFDEITPGPMPLVLVHVRSDKGGETEKR